MKKILKDIKGLFFYIFGQVCAALYYDKKYLTGRWFQGSLNGALSSGWEWVVRDSIMNRKLGTNKGVPWPVSPHCRVIGPNNIIFHPDDIDNFNTFGCYYQAVGKISIGHGTCIAPNVGIITANHDKEDLGKHAPAKSVVIGENCWLGMNSIILPGVELGDRTIVGAGSIVTKSFPEGNCLIAGNPAKKIKDI